MAAIRSRSPSQALTTNDAVGGRLTLGIGVSHQRIVEDFLGLDYSHPARYMTEYLQVLLPLLRGEKADYAGQHVRTSFRLDVSTPPVPPSVFIAAVGPKMLDVAGTYTAGAATWMVGLRTLAEQTVPLVRAAAERAGRPEPRILASLPIALTNDDETAAAWAADEFGMYGRLPAYKAVLEREGLDSAAGIADLRRRGHVAQGGRQGARCGRHRPADHPVRRRRDPPSHGRAPDQPPLARSQ